MLQRDAQELQAFPGQEASLEEADRLRREIDALRNRLTRMREASLRINESLNLPTVLQEVIDSACSLTGARYGALVAVADSGEIETLITSGITPEDRPRFGELPEGLGLLQYLNEIEEPLRLADIASHPRSVSFPKGHPPMKTFLGTPVRYLDQRLGNIYLTEKEGGYFPSLLEPRRRSERALLAVIQQAYVEGVSTRRVDDLVKALGCEGISKSQVSRICQELDVVVDGFLGRPLDGGPYPYLWLDALTQKVREDGRIVNVSVVVATAVNGEGKREIIGMDVGTSEDDAFWLAFLRSLSARGLSGVELVVSDAHQGLRGAIAAVFGGASWQRCRTHFMTNLLTRVPRRAQPWVATMVRTIYQQPSPDEVHAQLDRVTSQLHDRFPEVASLLDEAGPDVLAFSSFPLAHWKKLWSNNPQERLNKEIRRRTDVVGIFPNRPAVRRLVGAVLAEQHDEWVVGRRYLTPAILTFNEALPEADLAEATAA